MKRKIIKLGQATYVVSLPSKWVRKYNLKQGEYLEAEERERALVLSTEQLSAFKSITIALPRRDLFLKRFVYTPYRFGYDEITFTYKDPALIKEIQEAATILMGFDIVDQGETYCTFRNLSSDFENEFEHIFKRVFLLVLNLYTDSLDIIKKKEFSRFQHLADTEHIIDKLSCFCERVINKRGSDNFMKNSLAYITIWTLEQMGDDFKRLCAELSSFKELSSGTATIFAKTKEYFEHFFHVYYKPSLEGSLALKQEYRQLDELCRTSLLVCSKKEVHILHYLWSMISRINDISLSIQEFPEVR